MEMSKRWYGWQCTLSSEEVHYAQNEFVLKDLIHIFSPNQLGEITFRVVGPFRLYLMQVLMEGLGEGGFSVKKIFSSPQTGSDIVDKL